VAELLVKSLERIPPQTHAPINFLLISTINLFKCSGSSFLVRFCGSIYLSPNRILFRLRGLNSETSAPRPLPFLTLKPFLPHLKTGGLRNHLLTQIYAFTIFLFFVRLFRVLYGNTLRHHEVQSARSEGFPPRPEPNPPCIWPCLRLAFRLTSPNLSFSEVLEFRVSSSWKVGTGLP